MPFRNLSKRPEFDERGLVYWAALSNFDLILQWLCKGE